MMKLHMADMSWPEVQKLLKHPHAVLVPVGSTEQHGLHLPLSVDSACATYLAERAAEKVNVGRKIYVVVAPTVHYTVVNAFGEFPGSVGISMDTEISLLAEIAGSFVRQGFKNIIFVNGHGENVLPLNAALQKTTAAYPDAGLYAVGWPDLGFEAIPDIRRSSLSLHADELETSLSLLIQPENVHMEKATKEFPQFSLSEKWVKPDFYGPNHLIFHSRARFPRMGSDSGVMGDATVASKETGEKVAEAVVADLAEIIVEVVKSEGKIQEQKVL